MADSKDRFVFNEGDVTMRDGAGKELTRRQVLEQQYAQLSADEETAKNMDALLEGRDDEAE